MVVVVFGGGIDSKVVTGAEVVIDVVLHDLWHLSQPLVSL